MTGEAIIGPVSPPDLHVMTLNVRRRVDRPGWRKADRWEVRRPALEALLTSERPSLVGVQEARPDQTDAIAALGYRFAGRREAADGRGEGCPLFYESERLELLEWRQEALSDRPDVSGSTSWGNLIPRIMVSARLRDRATGTELLVINTHLDHLSARSRVRSAELIHDRVASQTLPVIVIGDLNAAESSRPVRELLRGGVARDAWTAASERLTPEWGTFANYRPPREGRARIDWIAVTPDVEVTRAAINATRLEGRWASDHLPVQAVVRLRGASPA